MPRVTVKSLQEEIEELKEKIDQLRFLVNATDKENMKLQLELDTTRKNQGVVSQQEFDFLLKNYETEQLQVKEYKRLYERENRLRAEGHDELLKRLEACENERTTIKNKTVHNARNAGRKPFSDERVIEQIKELHKQGYSLQQIADTLNADPMSAKKWAKSTVRYIIQK